MANYDYIDNTGVIVPDTSTLLTTVQNEFKNAFGQNIALGPQTPQGLLITGETLARSTVVRNNAALANQINPNEAGGVFLDAIWALTGGQRKDQTYSNAPGTLSGQAETIIPTSVVFANSNGDLFSITEATVLSLEGSASVTLVSQVPGPIAAVAGSINIIKSGVLGLETVTNTEDAIIGTDTQSDIAARQARRSTLALQGNALPEAIVSGVSNIPNVSKPSFRENVGDTVAVIDGITMQPHSMYTCVSGGTDLEVATVILSKKDGGCGYTNGASSHPVTVPVLQPASGQIYPVSFDRPDLIPILIRVTVKIESAVEDPSEDIKDAIMSYVNGEINGEPGFIVGMSVSCFELAGAVNTQVPGLFVQLLETTKVSPENYSTDLIPIALWQQATTNLDSIQVTLTPP